MPIPPENLTNNFAALTGMDPMVFTHNHSPGFEILPNGDALAVYFSTPPGKSEKRPGDVIRSGAAALRLGGMGSCRNCFSKRKISTTNPACSGTTAEKSGFSAADATCRTAIPFKMATSTDNGATWTLSLPQLDKPAENFTAQPITSAFRGGRAATQSDLFCDGRRRARTVFSGAARTTEFTGSKCPGAPADGIR